MYNSNSSHLKHLFIFIILFILFSTQVLIAQTPFTSQDALKVKSFRISAITDDGNYIAGTIGTRKDRMNTNHKRFGDPTYISASTSELVILNTKTKEKILPFKNKVQVSSLSWSPDNKQLAFILLKNNQYFLHIFSLGNKKVKEIKLKTDKSISSNSNLEWAPDGKSILLALREIGWADSSKAMFAEATVGPITIYDSQKPLLKWEEIRNMSSLNIVAIVNLETRKIKEILPEGRYNSLRQSKISPYISYIQYFPQKTSYDRKGGTDYALMTLNLEQDSIKPDTLIERVEKRLNLSWNENNDTFAFADSNQIFIQSITEEKPKNLTEDYKHIDGEDTTKVKFSMNRWSKDSSKLLASSKEGYWLIDYRSGDIKLVYKSPEDKEKAPNLRITNWSPDGKYLYFTYSAKDKWERGLVRYDLQNQKMEDLVKDSNLYSGIQMTKDGKSFIYTFSNGDLPANLFITDNEFSNKTQLTDLNPWIKDKKLTKSELIKYLDSDGNELYGILYYPIDYEAGKKYPLVCEIYETFFNNGFHTNMNILANAGFFGFRPSVKLNIGYPGEAWVKGITAGINKLIEKEMVDPNKLGVHGTSYGGYASSLLITQTDRFAAAINISGKTNMISFLGDSPRIGTRNYAAAEVGQDKIGATLWDAPFKYINHSAIMFADRVKTPHLLLTGQDDWNVPMASTREFYYALRRLGKECIWVDYVNAGHGAGRAGNEMQFHDMWSRIIDFYSNQFEKADKKEKEEK